MQLYELTKGDKFRIDEEGYDNTVFTFHHLDGMYSYCENKDKQPIHFLFSTPVVKEPQFPYAPEGYSLAKAYLKEKGEWDNSQRGFSTDGWSVIMYANDVYENENQNKAI